MAYEALKLKVGAEKERKVFRIQGGPYCDRTDSQKAWDDHVKASIGQGRYEGLTYDDYVDFHRQVSAGKTPASIFARSGKMTNSSSGTKRAGVQKTKSTGHSPSSGYTGVAYSQSDMDRAVARAIAGERQRIASVFSSNASFGRERVCADLLASSKGFSASGIVAELPNLPRDSERGRRPTGSAEQSAAVWKKAIAANYPGLKSADEPATGNSKKSVWDKAIARTFGTQGA